MKEVVRPRADALKDLHLPDDWGLETGVLTEIRRMRSSRRISRVDVADLHDCEHQP